MVTRGNSAVGGNTDPNMTVAEAKRNIKARIFGKMVAFQELKVPVQIPGDGFVTGYYKSIFGHITDADRLSIEFTDTMGEIHIFRGVNIKHFRPVGMKSWKMPKKFINQHAEI